MLDWLRRIPGLRSGPTPYERVPKHPRGQVDLVRGSRFCHPRRRLAGHCDPELLDLCT
ncbi:MAG TPA: hypothetical protein VG317_15075 [Pseudonocardiaceae bacterium]|nr:hypothetical protein [Pseudonocardiaceae bacterium]